MFSRFCCGGKPAAKHQTYTKIEIGAAQGAGRRADDAPTRMWESSRFPYLRFDCGKLHGNIVSNNRRGKRHQSLCADIKFPFSRRFWFALAYCIGSAHCLPVSMTAGQRASFPRLGGLGGRLLCFCRPIAAEDRREKALLLRFLIYRLLAWGDNRSFTLFAASLSIASVTCVYVFRVIDTSE